jgi:putative glutamine amidotransferase
VRPLIAVPGRLSSEAAGLRTEVVASGGRYLEALQRAGAEGAVLLPREITSDESAEILRRFDGLLLLGGGDVDPARYGAAPHEKLLGVEGRHDAMELTMTVAAIEIGLPVLAICRGFQVLNVALGGTLHQHITDDETTVQHRGHLHEVALEPGCRLALAVGADRVVGHSVHHQALDRIGDGLRVTGRAQDGIVESVELEDGWVVGVQWHPEDTAHEDVQQQALFEAFAAAARGR